MHGIQFNLLMAASCLVVLPVVIVFLLFQRFFIEGVSLGGK
jgi:multiple sugar transport system permease protein